MKALLASLISSVLVALTYIDLKDHVSTWLPQVVHSCFHSELSSDQPRVDYFAQIPQLDGLVCTYVNLYQQPLHDILGHPIFCLLIAAFGSVYTVMALEGVRRGFKKTSLLAAFPLFGLLANFIGIFAVFSLVFLPLSLYYRKKTEEDTKAWSITLADAYGTLVGVGLGYVLPTVLIASPLIQGNSESEKFFLSLWLVLPIFVGPFISFGTQLFGWFGSPIDKLTNAQLKERMYIAEGKDAVERTYLFLGSLNMFVYFTAVWVVAQKGIRIFDSLFFLLDAPHTLPVDLSFKDLGEILATRVLLVNYAALAIGFVLWAFFQGGLVAGVLVTLAIPIIGPTAAFSFFTYYRESLVQNMISDDPAAELAVLEAIKNAEKSK